MQQQLRQQKQEQQKEKEQQLEKQKQWIEEKGIVEVAKQCWERFRRPTHLTVQQALKSCGIEIPAEGSDPGEWIPPTRDAIKGKQEPEAREQVPKGGQLLHQLMTRAAQKHCEGSHGGGAKATSKLKQQKAKTKKQKEKTEKQNKQHEKHTETTTSTHKKPAFTVKGKQDHEKEH